ncbi:MAG: bifunctional 4-hydroxy-2-oxoglutarate aldolase/2-dehydro-3-deoxy-phosphogluconate aldolase [Clostridiales bacterium]|jgi:2-dehydro-3-deoxyphosphogluconate aldolase/(4S)-4-hydroxy-2-oxoglutarate aldolase|nr:bifunctional 4-hydroxy-2-oxoglutarate aldolase/2-dehydro-3-deoxy-phosphogluconate aldolase [Clostridiales bacterium]
MDINGQISKLGVVPVIKINKLEDTVPLAKALCAGGLKVAELTFRTDCAEGAIKIITEEVPEMLVGAGTVLNIETVDKAVAAGAKFIVTPGFNESVVKYCIGKGIPIYPGCPSSSDIEKAIALGLEVVKFFPAEQLGGLNMIKALAGPYNKIKFMPTGGVNQNNICSYLAYDKIVACGGSWMVKEELINAGEFDKITVLAREAVDTILGFELAHIGINAKGLSEAKEVAETFSEYFGKAVKEGNSSIFNGTEIEILKSPYLGASGHIAFRANNLGRAMYYLGQRGAKFNMDTAKYDAKGNLASVYLEGEIGGFAVHLVK